MKCESKLTECVQLVLISVNKWGEFLKSLTLFFNCSVGEVGVCPVFSCGTVVTGVVV